MLLYKIIILLLVSANVSSLVIAGQLFHESEERDPQKVKPASHLNLLKSLEQEGSSTSQLAILEDKVTGTKTLRDVLRKYLARRQQLKQSLNAQTSLTPQPNLSHLASAPYVPLEGDAILEMLRPVAENQDGFAISSNFYDPEGRPNPNLIRAIRVDETGASTAALFLIQINKAYASSKSPVIISAEKEASEQAQDWETKLVVKKLTTTGTFRYIQQKSFRLMSNAERAFRELRNLEVVRSSPLASLNYLQHPNLPIITFDEGFYFYDDVEGEEKHVFSILHAAKGNSFEKILKEYTGDEASSELLQTSAYNIGHSLGTFHVHFAQSDLNQMQSAQDLHALTTYIHGDFHWNNVFYDSKKKKTYWIDNQSIAISILNPQSIKKDFMKFYTQPFVVYRGGVYQRYSPKAMEIAANAFFKGYIDSYPAEIRPYLRAFVEEEITKENEKLESLNQPLPGLKLD